MFNKIKNNFFTGLVVILPIFLTIAILVFLVNKLNEKILEPMVKLFAFDFYHHYSIYIAKIIGFLIIVLLISLVGLATKLILLRRFFGFWENLLSKVPTIGKIYIGIKEISRAIFGQRKNVFKQVVLIEYPRKGMYALGFLTAQGCREIQEKVKSDTVSVFLPTTPNPTSGFFLVVPKKDILPLDLTVADGFKLVVSSGAYTPPNKNS